MGRDDALYRMLFVKEDEDYKKKVCLNALMFTIIISILVFAIILLLKQ